MIRYLTDYIRADLNKKMVFLGGPRQVGKTTLSISLLPNAKEESAISPAYFNWDISEDRARILRLELPKDEKIIIFDEIHKYSKWRNLVKGIFDKYKSRHSFLITGSARLDYYRRGGDSLQGRYHYYRLHPLSVGELVHSKMEFVVEDILKFGGFPEPYLARNEKEYKRWQRERITRVIKDDLTDLERVVDISSLQLLIDALPQRVGSPLSIQNLAHDLGVAHKTVARWLTIFDNLYLSFRISPYGSAKIRAVKKEQKLYLWDWSQCEDSGACFENLVASQLLKQCHFIEDTEGDEMELRYIRDTDRREVDFIVLKNKKPLYGVECKLHDTTISPHVRYFKERIPVPKWYQVHLAETHYEKDGVEVIPFVKLVKQLGLV